MISQMEVKMIRMAFSNLHLKKKPRIPVVGWLPPAYVVTTAKRGLLGMQSGLNSISMAVGATVKALYSSYTPA